MLQWWCISHLKLTYWVVCMLKASLSCYYGLHLTCSHGLTFTWWECSSNKACPPLFLILLFVTSPSLAHSPVFHFLNILPTDLRFPFHSWVLTSAMIFLSVCLPVCCGIFRVLHETGLLTSPKEKYQRVADDDDLHIWFCQSPANSTFFLKTLLIRATRHFKTDN